MDKDAIDEETTCLDYKSSVMRIVPKAVPRLQGGALSSSLVRFMRKFWEENVKTHG